MSGAKCNKTADKFRDDGNAHWWCKEFHDALVAYNKSLCYAEEGSEQLSLAYANRSAIYLAAKMFDKCLENVNLSISHGLDINKLSKLNEREEKCKKLMKAEKQNPQDDPWNFFKLSHPANKKIPFIVDCLELRENGKYGRYLVATSYLKPGDIIAIEEPFYKSIDKEFVYSRCSNCLKSNQLSLIPCPRCTNTMYCSSKCQVEHEKFIHRQECNKKQLPQVLVVCTKMLLTAVALAGSIGNLRELLDYSRHPTVFDYDLSHPDGPDYKKNLLLVVNSMAKSENSKIVISEKMKSTFDFPPFDELWKTDAEREFLIETFHNQLRIHNTNQLEMGEHKMETWDDPSSWSVKTIGGGLCPFASLFNHSCDANVKRTCIDNKIAFVVAAPIAAGEQLFLSYGYSSYRVSKNERQELLKRFSFICDCNACVKDFPDISKLPTFDRKFVEPKFSVMTVKEGVAEFRKNCEYIEKYFQHHPSYETTTLMIHNDHLLYQIARVSYDAHSK